MKLGFVTLYVPSVAETLAFYEQAFGLQRRFVHESGQYAEIETGETTLAFAAEDAMSETCPIFTRNRLALSPAGAEVAFVVEDVSIAFAAAVAAGATSHVEPTTKPWGQIISYVRDNNGFLVEICSEVID